MGLPVTILVIPNVAVLLKLNCGKDEELKRAENDNAVANFQTSIACSMAWELSPRYRYAQTLTALESRGISF